jgi:hypothetical protein
MAPLPQFQSTTLEGAFLEAAFLLQQGEINYLRSGDWKRFGENYQVPSYINITIDTDQQRAVIVATVPIGVTNNSFGGYLIARQFIENKYIAPELNIISSFYGSP